MKLSKTLHKVLIIALLISVIPRYAVAQEPESLRKSLVKLEGKEKVQKLLAIGKLYSEKYAQADSLLHYSKEGYKLASSINFESGKLKAKLYEGVALQQKNEFKKAIDLLGSTLKQAEGRNDYPLNGEITYYLARTYYRSGDNKLAIDYNLKSISAFEKANDNVGLALNYAMLAGLFINEQQYDIGRDYKNKILRILPTINDPFTKILVSSSLSGNYIQLREHSKLYVDSAIYYGEIALKSMQEFGYLAKANQICNAIADAYYLKYDYKKALFYAEESLKYRSYLFPGEIIISYLKYSDCANMIKDHESALLYLDSVKIALNEIDDSYYSMVYYERVYQFNKDAGNFSTAMYGLERYKAMQDSIFNLEKSTAINDLLLKYNKVEDEKKIVELNRKNERYSSNLKVLIIGIICTILLILVLIFFYRQSVLKSKFKLLETEQRLNRARMEPHFFFNALTSIKVLAEDETRSEKVPRLISKFAKIMRQSLESTYDENVTIETEIDFIQNYLELQKTRYPNKFDFSINLDDDIDSSEIRIPSMLLQPFLENSIEHGFKNMDGVGFLSIKIEIEQQMLKISCTDNGTGLQSNENSKTYTSRASQIVNERLSLLNKKHRSTAHVEINSEQNCGVQVIVFLPLII